MDVDTLLYSLCVLLSGAVLLDIGADKFIDHTARLASKARISQTVVALLTAGAEWEEVGSAFFFLSLSECYPLFSLVLKPLRDVPLKLTLTLLFLSVISVVHPP